MEFHRLMYVELGMKSMDNSLLPISYGLMCLNELKLKFRIREKDSPKKPPQYRKKNKQEEKDVSQVRIPV